MQCTEWPCVNVSTEGGRNVIECESECQVKFNQDDKNKCMLMRQESVDVGCIIVEM